MNPRNILRSVCNAGVPSTIRRLKTTLVTDMKQKCPLSNITGRARSEVTQTPICPFEKIPGARGLPLIGTLLDYTKNNRLCFTQIFKIFHKRSLQYGHIIKEKLGPTTMVSITDPEEYKKVIKVDGRTPIRPTLDPIAHYRKKKGLETGILNAQGEVWHKYRNVFNKKLMTPKEITKYIPSKNDVANDFAVRLDYLKDEKDGEIENLQNELFKWAMESTGTMLFEERLGCLETNPPVLATAFIENLQGFLSHLNHLLFSIPIYKVFSTKLWRQFEVYSDNLTSIAFSLLEQKIDKVRKQVSEGYSDDNQQTCKIMTHLILQDVITTKEATSIAMELLMASIESVSTSTAWTLYCLAKNPDIQEKLYEHIQNTVGHKKNITSEMLQQLPYLKACFKEAVRVYPTVFMISRILKQDIEICGYHVPAGAQIQANLYTISRDSNLFPRPNKYIPERWMDGSSENGCKYFYNLLFGHGPRMCLGRRMAELDIHLILIKIIQNFRLEYHHEDVKPEASLILIPDRPINIKFTARDKSE